MKTYACYDNTLEQIFEVWQTPSGRWKGSALWEEGAIEMKCTFKKGFKFENSEQYILIGDI